MELLRTALKDPSCGTSSGGQIHKCQTFQPFLQDGDLQNQCPDLPGRLQETVTGVLSSLPGCNRLQYGPKNAVVETCDKFSKSGKPAGFDPSAQPNANQPGQLGQQGEGSSDGTTSDSDQSEVVVVEETHEVTEHTEVQEKQPKENSASSCRGTWVGAAVRYWRYKLNGIQFAMFP